MTNILYSPKTYMIYKFPNDFFWGCGVHDHHTNTHAHTKREREREFGYASVKDEERQL